MSKSKQTQKPAKQKPAANELSETALAQAAGGSFSWGMQNTAMGDGSVRTGLGTPSELLPAVQKTAN